MPPVKRFHWDSEEYAQAFATLVQCAGDRTFERQLLRELFAAYPAESPVVDWGAGSGDLTRLLLERFQHVYAVEPHVNMRAALAARCPQTHMLRAAKCRVRQAGLEPGTKGRIWQASDGVARPTCDADARRAQFPLWTEALQPAARL